MNKRDLSLDKYGISKHRYRELYNFCLQYNDFIKAKQDCYSLPAVMPDGMPKRTDKTDPTATKAERALKLAADIELIEQTAIEAAGDLYPWLMKAVTSEGLQWRDLSPPCGVRQFREIRRKYYFLLNLKKG